MIEEEENEKALAARARAERELTKNVKVAVDGHNVYHYRDLVGFPLCKTLADWETKPLADIYMANGQLKPDAPRPCADCRRINENISKGW